MEEVDAVPKAIRTLQVGTRICVYIVPHSESVHREGWDKGFITSKDGAHVSVRCDGDDFDTKLTNLGDYFGSWTTE